MQRNSRFPAKLKIMALLAGCSLTPIAQAVAATPPVLFASEGAAFTTLNSPWERHQSLWLAANGSAMAPPQFEAIQRLRVGKTDTLWSLARDQRPKGVTIKQAMLGILEANPSAFTHHNINALGAGNLIQIPDAEFMKQYSATEAAQEVNRQNQVWPKVRRTPARKTAAELVRDQASATSQATPEEIPPTSATPVETLVETPASTVSPSATQPNSAAVSTGPSNDTSSNTSSTRTTSSNVNLSNAAQTNDEAATNEALNLNTLRTEVESLRQERDQMQRQLAALQDQLKTAQQLMTIKDQQLSELKNRQDSLASQVKGRPDTPSAQPAASNVNALSASNVSDSSVSTSDPTTALLDSVKQQPMLYGGGAAILGLLALIVGMRRARKTSSTRSGQKEEQQTAASQKSENSSAENDKAAFQDLPALDDLDMSNEDFEALLMKETEALSEAPEAVASPEENASPDKREALLHEVTQLLENGRVEPAAGLLQRYLSEQPDDDVARLKLMALLVQLADRDTFDHHYHALMARIPAPEIRYEAELLAAEFSEPSNTTSQVADEPPAPERHTRGLESAAAGVAMAPNASEAAIDETSSSTAELSEPSSEIADSDTLDESPASDELEAGDDLALETRDELGDSDELADMDELDELDLSEFDDEFSPEASLSAEEVSLGQSDDDPHVTPEEPPVVVLDGPSTDDEAEAESASMLSSEDHEAYGQTTPVDDGADWLRGEADEEIPAMHGSSPSVVLDDPLAPSLGTDTSSMPNDQTKIDEAKTDEPDDAHALNELDAFDERDLGLDEPLAADELNEQDEAPDLEPLDATNTDTDEFMAALDGLSLDESLTHDIDVSDHPLMTDESVSKDDLDDLEALFGLSDEPGDIDHDTSTLTSERGATPEQQAAFDEDAASEGNDVEDDLDDLADLELPELSEASSQPTSQSVADLHDEEYLNRDSAAQNMRSWEDELADLDGLDELDYDAEFPLDDIESNMATQLDLANAYVEMGDAAGAREILNQVLSGGNDTQRKAAQALLERLNAK